MPHPWDPIWVEMYWRDRTTFFHAFKIYQTQNHEKPVSDVRQTRIHGKSEQKR